MYDGTFTCMFSPRFGNGILVYWAIALDQATLASVKGCCCFIVIVIVVVGADEKIQTTVTGDRRFSIKCVCKSVVKCIVLAVVGVVGERVINIYR